MIIWPAGFPRIPSQSWTTHPVEQLALGYDTVEQHGWYDNLEPTVEQLRSIIEDGEVVLDYSGGTGILADRLLRRMQGRRFGFLIVDSSPKFLRLALEKHGADERIAFRLIRFLKESKRLELVEEVLEPSMRERGVDVLTSTNAIHLYYDLVETLRSWARVLRSGGRVLIQSGNIRNPAAGESEWIIDETVDVIHRAAREIVELDPRFERYRTDAAAGPRMQRYDALRHKFFLPVRALEHYTAALEQAGFDALEVESRTIKARVDEWREFLAVYHEGVLGWLGGAEKLEGRVATQTAIDARLELLGLALQRVFGGGRTFDACWTYITCRRP